MGTTVGRGDYAAGDMGQDYTQELMADSRGGVGLSGGRGGGGGGAGTLEQLGNGWGLLREGSGLGLTDRRGNNTNANGSTPVATPVFDQQREWSGGRGGGGRSRRSAPEVLSPSDEEVSLDCGFEWYRNTALFRHRSSSSGSHTECEAVRSRLVSLCSNSDGQLWQLCEALLGISFSEEGEEGEGGGRGGVGGRTAFGFTFS